MNSCLCVFLVVLEGMRIGSETVSPFDFKIQPKKRAENWKGCLSSVNY